MVESRIAPDVMVVVSPNQVSTSLGSEAVILGAEAGQYFGLNDVGARVWELIQNPVLVSAICDAIRAEYEVGLEECERDVIDLLNELQAKGLLDVRSSTGSP